MGASQSRNPNLAAVFYRLGLVESYGTGVRKILRLYHGFDPLPIFRAAEGAFTVEMANRNERASALTPETDAKKAGKTNLKEKIVALAKEKGELTRKDVEKEYRIGSTKAYKFLKQLCEEGMLVQVLNGNKTVYVPE